MVNNNVTETINNVTVNGSAVSIFNQEFIAASSNVLTWTQNNGTLPVTNLNASVHVQAHRDGEEIYDEWVGMYESTSWEEGAYDLIHGAKREIFATKYAGSTVGTI